MQRASLLLAFISAVAIGCTTSRVISPQKLPLFGDSPLKHTIYMGSDEEFHYFNVQDGLSASRLRVPVEDADIVPSSRSLGGGTSFIERIDGRAIYLLQLQSETKPL